VYLGLKTISTYKTANMFSSNNVNTNLKVEYLKCQGERKLDTSVCQRILIGNMIQFGAIEYDGVRRVRLFLPVFRRTAHKYGHIFG